MAYGKPTEHVALASERDVSIRVGQAFLPLKQTFMIEHVQRRLDLAALASDEFTQILDRLLFSAVLVQDLQNLLRRWPTEGVSIRASWLPALP